MFQDHRRKLACVGLALTGALLLSARGAASAGGINAGSAATPLQAIGAFGSGYSADQAAAVYGGPVAGLLPHLEPPVPGDANGDNAVDLQDAAELAACMSGPAIVLGTDGRDAACRRAFDLDGDATISLLDAAEFSLLFGLGE